MSITKKKRGGEFFVLIDGEALRLPEAAERLAIPEKRLRVACMNTRKKDFEEKIKTIQWRIKNGIGATEKVWVVDGQFVAVKTVMREAGISSDAASRRIKKAVEEKKGLDFVLRPMSAATIKRIEGCRKKVRRNEINIEGLGPRRNINDLGGPGSWEKENLDPKHFYKSGGGAAKVHLRENI